MRVGLCPVCDYGFHEQLRCEDSIDKKEGCYLTKLEQSLDTTDDASTLSEISEVEAQLALKLFVTIDQVRADVFPAMIILHEERERWNKENKT